MSILPLPALGDARRCTKCERLFPATNEFFRNQRPGDDSLRCWCRDCTRAISRASNQTRRAQGRQSKTELRVAALRREVNAIKLARGCESPSCLGHPAHPAVIEFDHLPGFEKVDAVANLVRGGRRDAVLAEIAKCRSLCSNCHQLSTAERPELRRGRGAGRRRAPKLVPLPEPDRETTVLPLPALEPLERSA